MGVGIIITFILLIKKLKFRNIKQLVSVHIDDNWLRLDLNCLNQELSLISYYIVPFIL